MSAETLRALPWGEIVAISVAAFIAVKLLARTGWINVVLLPLLAPPALFKLMIFSLMGRTRPYLERLQQSEEVSNQMLFRGKIAAEGAGALLQGALREPLAQIARRWNADHRWFEGPMTLVLQGGEIVGFCRLFTFPRALGLGADRRVYRDVEHVLGFLEQSARELEIEWTVLNTIGLSGTVGAEGADKELLNSLADFRGTVFWRHPKAAS